MSEPKPYVLIGQLSPERKARAWERIFQFLETHPEVVQEIQALKAQRVAASRSDGAAGSPDAGSKPARSRNSKAVSTETGDRRTWHSS